MLKEIGHFIRIGKEVSRLQKQHPRAEFADLMMAKADAQGYADVRRELVGDLTGRVLEIGAAPARCSSTTAPARRWRPSSPKRTFSRSRCRRRQRPGKDPRRRGRRNEARASPTARSTRWCFGLVLCSVPSVERVLAEAFRVLRGGGSCARSSTCEATRRSPAS